MNCCAIDHCLSQKLRSVLDPELHATWAEHGRYHAVARIDYLLVIADGSTVIRPYLDSAFAKASLEPLPIIETNAIEIVRHAAIFDNGITFLTPFDIEFERRVGRLVYVPVRELVHETQTLMLIGHERSTSAIASVLAEMLTLPLQPDCLPSHASVFLRTLSRRNLSQLSAA